MTALKRGEVVEVRRNQLPVSIGPAKLEAQAATAARMKVILRSDME